MSGRGRYRGNRHRGETALFPSREKAVSLPADSLVLATFKQAALALTIRQDRHERLVKLSRDVTIESKRIIFLLHSAITKDSSEKIIIEANERIHKLIEGPLKHIGVELKDSPKYLHNRAVTAGFQEYIEARTLLSLIEKGEIPGWAELQKELTYSIKEGDEEMQLVSMLTRSDYMLGLADLTGELMRRSMNVISSGDTDDCFDACQVLRVLYAGFLSLCDTDKRLVRKLRTTRTNVDKVEMALYALKVIGGEVPRALLLARADPPPGSAPPDCHSGYADEDDEGFY